MCSLMKFLWEVDTKVEEAVQKRHGERPIWGKGVWGCMGDPQSQSAIQVWCLQREKRDRRQERHSAEKGSGTPDLGAALRKPPPGWWRVGMAN